MSTIRKPLTQAENMLNSPTFLSNLLQINSLLKGNKLPVQLQEIRTMFQYAGSKFNIETGRAFQKYKETQLLSIALYYGSWRPFIQHITASKEDEEKKIIKLNIPEGMKIIDKNSHEVVLHVATIIIPQQLYSNNQEFKTVILNSNSLMIHKTASKHSITQKLMNLTSFLRIDLLFIYIRLISQPLSSFFDPK